MDVTEILLVIALLKLEVQRLDLHFAKLNKRCWNNLKTEKNLNNQICIFEYFFLYSHEPKWMFRKTGWKRNYGCKWQITPFQMTAESGAKQTQYLLLVFLQAKMLRLGRCPKSPCDNPCGRGRISVIKTLLFTQCTDCFWSVFETERLGGYERNEKAHLIILLPSAKPACFQILLISNEELWCTYCGPGGQGNKVKQWRSALVQESFPKHFKNAKKNTEHGCWTAEKYVTCLEISKTEGFLYFSENRLPKHLQTGVYSFWEEVC